MKKALVFAAAIIMAASLAACGDSSSNTPTKVTPKKVESVAEPVSEGERKEPIKVEESKASDPETTSAADETSSAEESQAVDPNARTKSYKVNDNEYLNINFDGSVWEMTTDVNTKETTFTSDALNTVVNMHFEDWDPSGSGDFVGGSFKAQIEKNAEELAGMNGFKFIGKETKETNGITYVLTESKSATQTKKLGFILAAEGRTITAEAVWKGEPSAEAAAAFNKLFVDISK